jgi:hypothetical protein
MPSEAEPKGKVVLTERTERKRTMPQAFSIEKLEMIPSWAQASLGLTAVLRLLL